MIDGIDLDKWFDNFVKGALYDGPVFCPFLEFGADYMRCPLEGSNIKIDFYNVNYQTQTTAEGKSLKCKCLQINNQGFRDCDTFKKAYAQYKANPIEFKAFMSAVAGKAYHKCDKWREFKR